MAEKRTRPKRAPAKKLSFGEAVSEVEQILAGLEQDEIDIDRLSEEVKRAVELIQVCREKLEKTDTEVRDLVAELQQSGSEDETSDGSGKDSGEDLSF
ncbi:MAG: exodeoxyribonuclease VII small subunit [Candidatus Krumholzibacteria bacterium]|nr:exodeoxyribonuclease VII small subunit [Candidatus Krumholzibacteria bacterium]